MDYSHKNTKSFTKQTTQRKTQTNKAMKICHTHVLPTLLLATGVASLNVGSSEPRPHGMLRRRIQDRQTCIPVGVPPLFESSSFVVVELQDLQQENDTTAISFNVTDAELDNLSLSFEQAYNSLSDCVRPAAREANLVTVVQNAVGPDTTKMTFLLRVDLVCNACGSDLNNIELFTDSFDDNLIEDLFNGDETGECQCPGPFIEFFSELYNNVFQATSLLSNLNVVGVEQLPILTECDETNVTIYNSTGICLGPDEIFRQLTDSPTEVCTEQHGWSSI